MSGAAYNIIVFSLNRACQLHAFLESWQRFVTGAAPSVIYCYTSEPYHRGYQRIVNHFYDFADFRPQVHFRVDTLAAVDPAKPYTVFFVDDMLFRRPVDFTNDILHSPLHWDGVAAVSFHLSPYITRSFNLNRDTPPPFPFDDYSEWLEWTWPNRPGEWGYPMSLDGHIFRTADLLPLMQRLEWSNPNTLEANLASNPLPRNKMACLREHVVMNIPANLVQHVYQNRTCKGRSAEELNAAYLAGQRIDINPLVAMDTSSCHVAAEYQLI